MKNIIVCLVSSIVCLLNASCSTSQISQDVPVETVTHMIVTNNVYVTNEIALTNHIFMTNYMTSVVYKTNLTTTLLPITNLINITNSITITNTVFSQTGIKGGPQFIIYAVCNKHATAIEAQKINPSNSVVVLSPDCCSPYAIKCYYVNTNQSK